MPSFITHHCELQRHVWHRTHLNGLITNNKLLLIFHHTELNVTDFISLGIKRSHHSSQTSYNHPPFMAHPPSPNSKAAVSGSGHKKICMHMLLIYISPPHYNYPILCVVVSTHRSIHLTPPVAPGPWPSVVQYCERILLRAHTCVRR
jgi:hypothetical protein